MRASQPCLATAALLVACLPLAAPAQNAPPPLHVRTTAAMCASCHGTNGKAAEGSALASLAGMAPETMVAAMKGFKDGSRPATVMHQLSKGFTDDQIGQLAAYFATVR